MTLLHDYSFWGIWIVPLGVAICFGPALLAWFKAEASSDDEKNTSDKR